MQTKIPKFIPDKCPHEHCQQTYSYAKDIAKGGALALIGIYNRVQIQGTNDVYLPDITRKPEDFENGMDEMLSKGFITESMKNNISMLYFHGLVARVKGAKQSHVLITRKGANLLRGEDIWKCIIRSKVTGANLGPYTIAGKTNLKLLLKKNQPMWDYPRHDDEYWVDVDNSEF